MVHVGTVLLEPFAWSETLKLFIVVIAVPIATNAYTFYVYDQVLKKRLGTMEDDDSVMEENFFTDGESLPSHLGSDLDM